jgi:H+-transporting ATPase
VHALPGVDEAYVLGMAALASSDGGQDPVDGAIRAAAAQKPVAGLPKLVKFIPFDPATKMSEATATDSGGAAIRAVKGAFAVVSSLAQPSPDAPKIVSDLEGQGFRVLAVAYGPPAALKLAGIIALAIRRDRTPPRWLPSFTPWACAQSW